MDKKTILTIVAAILVAGVFAIWLSTSRFVKNSPVKEEQNASENTLQTQEVECGKAYQADIFAIRGVDVVKRIIELKKEKGQACQFNIAGNNIGVALQASKDNGKLYTIALYDKDDSSQSQDPFGKSAEIYQVNLGTNTISSQSQFDGSFESMGSYIKVLNNI